MKFLHPDSKFMYYAFKFSDLVTLNILFIVCSLPILTIGASLSAMHYVLLGILRDNLDHGIAYSFFKSFRANFKQGTAIWLLYLLIGCIIAFDLYLFQIGILTLSPIVKYIIYIVGFIMLCSMNWVFILQSRYTNPILATIRNSFLFCVFHFWDTLLMTAFICVPFILVILSSSTIPVIFICGFAVCGILQTFFYNRIFHMHEKMVEDSLNEIAQNEPSY